MMMTNNARVILAVAAERDDDFIWDRLKTLQAEMLEAGPVSMKFAYFGAEGALASRPCITTLWVTDPNDMVELMDKARAQCVCGCYVDIGDIFTEALKETKHAPVQAVIILGDVFHGDLDQAMAHARELGAAGTRLFLFQQTSSRLSGDSEDLFQSLAVQSGGASFKFNPAIERIAEKLPGMLHAVTRFAIGGTDALEALDDQSAVLLLERMS
jgi:hypothetical protein